MKRIGIVLGCVLLSTQLVAEHSWAQCENCVRQGSYRSMKSSFDPEWHRWDEGDSAPCGSYDQRCEEDDSELINPV